MKVKYLKLSLLFFVPLLLQQVAWASGENIDDARRIHFSHQPSESRNVVFEDTSLTQLEQRCILQDYQVLIGHLEIEGSRQIGKERQTTLEQKAGNLFVSCLSTRREENCQMDTKMILVLSLPTSGYSSPPQLAYRRISLAG